MQYVYHIYKYIYMYILVVDLSSKVARMASGFGITKNIERHIRPQATVSTW